ncbi:DUF167 domain-containing protein [bacterium]|nr:DUF167 domain-containing protein [bacterium]
MGNTLENLKKQLEKVGEIVLDCKVISNSKKSEIIGFLDDNVLKIKINSVREKGRANKEVVKLLAKYFSVNTSKVNIKKGELNSYKTIRIEK